MEVYFASHPTRGMGTAVHNIAGKNYVFKEGGIHVATDKNDVVDILASEVYRRGEVKLVSDHDVVEKYLSGEEPDKFTMDVLNSVSDEGLRELAAVYQTKEKVRSMIIKAELRGKPVINAAVNILETYPLEGKKKQASKREVVEAAVEAGQIIKAGVWYKLLDDTFKTKNIEEMYEKLQEK